MLKLVMPAILFALLVASGCDRILGEPDRFIVAFDRDRDLPLIIKELSNAGFRVLERLDIINGVVCHLNEKEKDVIASLECVRYLEEDKELFVLEQNEFMFSFNNTNSMARGREVIDWGIKRINADKTWNLVTGKGISVGIVDTGIKDSHPDLRGVVIGGFDAVDESSYEDDNGHGTYVASIVSARRNGLGIVGVAPDSLLFAIKVIGNRGRGYISDVLEGCQWALNEDVKLLNMSFGSEYESIALMETMDILSSKGVITVAAVGNRGNYGIYCPAKSNSTVCVGASGLDDQRMSWSNYGPELKENGVLAPGDWILVANKDGDWLRVSGTSIATPHVTGAIALLMQAGVTDPFTLRKLLFKSASKAETPDELSGHGVINVEEAFKMVKELSSSHTEKE